MKTKKNEIAHLKGGSSGRELGLVILCFCVFFVFLFLDVFCFCVCSVLFSHCRDAKQKLSMVAQ